jgi:catechol 2,3-dioxygenase-like lactoylglutathione lyase family enzyme
MSAIFKSVTPYADNPLNLPVADVDAAIPFYEKVMGFRVVSRTDSPQKSVILTRDDIHIGLAENGGDPTQEGCFFEVDDAERAFQELRSNGLGRDEPGFRIDLHGDATF